MRLPIVCALALAWSLPVAGQMNPMPDLREAVIAKCYSTNGREKRIHDLAQEIDAAQKLGNVPGDLWRRYKDLGGKAEEPAEAKALSPDPCAKLKESLPPAAAKP